MVVLWLAAGLQVSDLIYTQVLRKFSESRDRQQYKTYSTFNRRNIIALKVFLGVFGSNT